MSRKTDDEIIVPPPVKYAPARPWVGGGSIAAVADISPHTTPVQAYLEMTGQALMPSAEQLKFFRRRQLVEPYVLAVLEEERGMQIAARNVRYDYALLPFIRTEIDAEENRGDRERRNIEIKSVHPYAAKPWGEAGSDVGVPHYVIAQVTLGLHVTGRHEALTVGQVGFDDGRLYEVSYDAALAEMLLRKAEEFWTKHVIPRVPPKPRTVEDALLLFPRSQMQAIVATEEIYQHLRAMVDIDNSAKTLEERKELHSAAVRAFMGEADTLLREGQGIIATYKSNKQGRKVDHENLVNRYEAHLLHHGGLGMADWIMAQREACTTYPVPQRPLNNKLKRK